MLEYGDGDSILFNGHSKKFIIVPSRHINNYLYIIRNCNALKDAKEAKVSMVLQKLIKMNILVESTLDERQQVREEIQAYADKDEFHTMILPTYDCNYKCWYCVQLHHKTEMPPHTVKLVERHIVKYLESNKIPRYVLYWFGGEPLLQKDIVGKLTTALGAYCRDNNIEFVGQITTNGALLDIPTIKMLRQAQVNSYQITLDGDRRLHDKTKFDGMHESSFNTIAGNVANLLRINTEAIVVLRYNYTQKNVGHLSVVDELCQYIPDELRQRVRIDLQRVWQVNGDSVSLSDLGRLQRKFVDNGFALLTLGMFEPCYVEKHRFEVIYYNGRVDVCDNYAFDKARGMITESGLVDWRQAVEIPDLHKVCLDCPYLPVCLEECPAKRLRAKSSGKEFICTEEIKRHVEFTIKDYCLRIINNKRVK